jgi:xanthine dehydrogenase YagS FAD-binding subunit
VALDGIVVVRSANGESHQVKAAEFFVLPEKSLKSENILYLGQIVSEVILPTRPAQSATIEIREKQSFDWPVAMACVARLEIGWRVCLGAVAPIPWLSQSAMDELGNKDITPQLAAAAGEAAVKNAEPMSENEYKVQLTKTATKRALLLAAGLEVPRWN